MVTLANYTYLGTKSSKYGMIGKNNLWVSFSSSKILSQNWESKAKSDITRECQMDPQCPLLSPREKRLAVDLEEQTYSESLEQAEKAIG